MSNQVQLDFLKTQNLNASDKFLDFGCGELDGGVPVIEYLNEGNYYGTDIRIRTLIDGQRNMKAAGLKAKKKPHFIHLDTYEALKFDDHFDVIWAFNVFTHLNDHQVQKALEFIGKWMKAEGKLIANVTIGDSADGEWNGFPKVSRSENFYTDKAKAVGLLLTPLGKLNDLGFDGVTDQEVMLSFCRDK